MRKIVLFFMILIVPSLVMAVQHPAPFFCESQGYNSAKVFILDYEGKDVYFVSNYSASIKNEDYLFMINFRWPVERIPNAYNSAPYNKIIDIKGLNQLEKNQIIQKILNQESFGNYNLTKSDIPDFDNYYIVTGKLSSYIYCTFPGGYKCSWINFQDEKCGLQYRKEIPCVKEGESIRTSFQQCCKGIPSYYSGNCPGCLPKCTSNIFKIILGFFRNII